jgi:hypothetical protein
MGLALVSGGFGLTSSTVRRHRSKTIGSASKVLFLPGDLLDAESSFLHHR